ncbi:MAG: LPP20 family lipoprotein [Proteobacteria bacterium]|nr:LPP20 family lipoprotein [Pseudomonadota bacterium]
MRYISYSLIAAIMIVSGCTGKVWTKDKAGNDVEGTSPRMLQASEFPSSKYLRATASGQSDKEARSQAKAELSNIFESQVFSHTINKVKSVTHSGEEEKVSRDAEQTVRVLSSVGLKGLEIGKVWFEEKEKLYYALAVLDRNKARENWQSEADIIDSKIGAAYKARHSQKSSFTKLQALRKMNKLWIEKAVIVSRLRVLGFQDVSTEDYDIKTIFSEIEEIKANLLIYIKINDREYGKIVSETVTEKLSEEGYVMTADKGRANIILRGSVTVKPVQLDNRDWQFARAMAVISIIDADSGLTVGEISDNKRAAHINVSEASVKSVRGVASLISDKMVQYFGDAE